MSQISKLNCQPQPKITELPSTNPKSSLLKLKIPNPEEADDTYNETLKSKHNFIILKFESNRIKSEKQF